MAKMRQPILIVQGDLDRQVVAQHADTLGTLAKARKKVAADRVQVDAPRWRQPPARAGEDAGTSTEYPQLDGEDGRPASREDEGGLAGGRAQAELKFGATASPSDARVT